MKKQLFFSLLIIFALLNTAKGQWSLTGNYGTTAGTNFLGTVDAKDLVFKTYTTERLRILSTGNIGIGTPTPLATLHINGNQQISNGVSKIGLGSADGANLGWGTGYLGFNALRNQTAGTWTIDGDNANNGGGVIWGNVMGGITFATIPRTAGTTQTITDAQIISNAKMTILDNGAVGIGTTGPLERLQVDKGNIKIRGTNNFSATGDQAVLFLGDGNNYIRSVYGKGVAIGGYTYTAPYYADAINIALGGNVGIGTSAPGNFKLAVEGTIGAREIKVLTTIPFPDFVFRKDYKLMSIYELESYIATNNHLPEIPSAKEIENSNGVALGEMQLKLLQKLEEQTLYIIQLQKQIDELKESVRK
jgi:hypothetical protein